MRISLTMRDAPGALANVRPHHMHSHVCVQVRACVFGRGFVHANPRRNVRALSVGMDRVRFGSQVFKLASAFNANIGAWNTARVTNMDWVCFAYDTWHATAADVLGRGSMRRGPCAWRHRQCACACVCAHY